MLANIQELSTRYDNQEIKADMEELKALALARINERKSNTLKNRFKKINSTHTALLQVVSGTWKNKSKLKNMENWGEKFGELEKCRDEKEL